MPSVCTIHFGCRANQADGAALETELSRRGFERADDCSVADVVVLNSCTVTAAADSDLRQTVRRVHRENPQARILVTGCYAQRRPAELADLPGVQWVVGNSHKGEIGHLLSQEGAAGSFVPLERLLGARPPSLDIDALDFRQLGFIGAAENPPSAKSSPRILTGEIFAQRQLTAAPFFGGVVEDRTRPNLKIQDGCNSRCSFCIIPSVRGLSRSLPVEEVLRQVRALCSAGYREVVLSGVNLGQHGRDLPGKPAFPRLLRTILEETPAERLRISSVEPMDWTDPLLDLMASTPRIAPHIHAPLQSGSDRILRRMHRKYCVPQYRDRILAAFERLPNAAFGADVMVGFPGESDADFEQTRRLIESLPFTYLHVFSFSRRPGTPADRMKDQVHGTVARERSRILRELAREKNRRFQQRQVGRTLTALTLEESARGGTTALSENYLKVLIAGEQLPANRWVSVQIVAAGEAGLIGRRVPAALDSYGLDEPSFLASPSMITSASA